MKILFHVVKKIIRKITIMVFVLYRLKCEWTEKIKEIYIIPYKGKEFSY